MSDLGDIPDPDYEAGSRAYMEYKMGTNILGAVIDAAVKPVLKHAISLREEADKWEQRARERAEEYRKVVFLRDDERERVDKLTAEVERLTATNERQGKKLAELAGMHEIDVIAVMKQRDDVKQYADNLQVQSESDIESSAKPAKAVVRRALDVAQKFATYADRQVKSDILFASDVLIELSKHAIQLMIDVERCERINAELIQETSRLREDVLRANRWRKSGG